MPLRVYTQERLKDESKGMLQKMLDSVKVNPHLTQKEIELNIEAIEFAIDGHRPPNESVMRDILDGQGDMDDFSTY